MVYGNQGVVKMNDINIDINQVADEYYETFTADCDRTHYLIKHTVHDVHSYHMKNNVAEKQAKRDFLISIGLNEL